MNMYDFRAQVNNAEFEEEIDDLCLQRLKEKADSVRWFTYQVEGRGNKGHAAKLLLDAYEILTS